MKVVKKTGEFFMPVQSNPELKWCYQKEDYCCLATYKKSNLPTNYLEVKQHKVSTENLNKVCNKDQFNASNSAKKTPEMPIEHPSNASIANEEMYGTPKQELICFYRFISLIIILKVITFLCLWLTK